MDCSPWTIARQAPLSMGFSRQECWSGLPFPSPGDCLSPGIEPMSPALAGGFFTTELLSFQGLPGGASGKEPSCQCRRHKILRFNLWVRKIPARRAQQPSPAFLSGESHGQRSLVGSSPWGLKESDTTEQLSMHTPTYQNLYFIFLNPQAVPNVT